MTRLGRALLPAVPAVPRREALLLVPHLPAVVAVLGAPHPWEPALAAVGLEPAPADGRGRTRPGLAVGEDARALAATGADQVLLVGTDATRALRRAGYDVLEWRITRTRLGASALVPVGRHTLVRQLRTGGAARRPRQVAADTVRRLQGGRRLTIGVRRGPLLPHLLREQPTPPTLAALLVGEVSERRRPVFLLFDERDQLERVVKVGFGAEGMSRGRTEQEALRRLANLGMPGVPVPLGSGRLRSLGWSAESALPGRPLGEVLATSPPDAGLHLLTRAADYLGDLAAATVAPPPQDRGLVLRPPYDVVAALVPPTAPGVLVHGDFHGNAQIDGDALHVIDWELARVGLPLQDLLPLLCTGLAAVRRTAPDEITRLLPALRGEGPDGVWLIGQVRRALARLDVPVQQGPALAASAMASWASMRLAHDELVAAAGGQVVAWSSAADVLAPAWFADPALGTSWEALVRGEGTA